MNIWKISTLVLAGALVCVVSSGGGVRETQACDIDDVSQQVDMSRQRLRAAFGLLDRTADQLADSTPSVHRARALEHVSLAMIEVKKDLALQNKPRPRPRPPMVRAKIVGFDE